MEIEAALGRLAIQGEPLFLMTSAGQYRLDYLGQLDGQEVRFSYRIDKVGQKIDVYVTDMTSRSEALLDITISTPGPIVGPALGDKAYRGLYFSSTPNEYHGNLFDLLELLAKSVELVNCRLHHQKTKNECPANQSALDEPEESFAGPSF
jgi:hypothetical protein